MSIACNMGFHKWDGCTCMTCGKTRDERHVSGCVCKRCGKTLNGEHEWRHIGKYTYKFGRPTCKCSICGVIRDDNHNWSSDCERCSICGKRRTGEYHNWDGCWCSVCGKYGEERHDWSKDCEKCAICGKTRNEGHDWTKDNSKCTRCGKTKRELWWASLTQKERDDLRAEDDRLAWFNYENNGGPAPDSK
jgi:hypothetical protein